MIDQLRMIKRELGKMWIVESADREPDLRNLWHGQIKHGRDARFGGLRLYHALNQWQVGATSVLSTSFTLL